jgi:mannose-1-phosphate guanylyltransferase
MHFDRMNYAVIMAGGSGTRFWPLSRKALPKQFLSLFGGTSLIRQTYERIKPLFPDERIYVVTNSSYVDQVHQHLPELPTANIIGEPIAKNTAPCVAMISSLLLAKDPEAVLCILPADHAIVKADHFREVLQLSLDQANDHDGLFTIGIKPNRPETGYGYIQVDSAEKGPVYPVKTFAEKPDQATAEAFLASGDFLWNSGMFIWKASTIMNEFETHLPNIAQLCTEMKPGLLGNAAQHSIDTFYHQVESISIDYGIMEKARQVFVIQADFGWSDVGSWLAAWELSDKDASGNSIQGKDVEIVNSHNSYVLNAGDRLIALVGMEDVVVVDTGDAILIMPKSKSQEVKTLIEKKLPSHGDRFL